MKTGIRIMIQISLFLIGWKLLQGDSQMKECSFSKKKKAVAGGLAYLCIAALIKPYTGEYAGCLFWVSLALAATSDFCMQEVYDVIFLMGVLESVGTMILLCGHPSVETVVGLVLFVVLQAVLFRRFYGGADCICFSSCAAFFAAQGKGFEEDVYLMAATFLFLFLIQAFRKNINRKGNLKKPVPLIPYIAAAMLLR